jgi:hypothetical protein
MRPCPKRAALLFVGEHALQRRHLRCEIDDVSLGVIDDREPLVEPLQALDRMLARRGHGLIEMMRHRVEPLINGAVKLGLAAREHVAHGLNAHRSLGLQPCQLKQLLISGLRLVPTQHAQDDSGQREDARKPRKRDRNGERQKMIGHPRHRTSIRRMRTKYEQ